MAKSRVNRASPSLPYEVLFQMVIGKWISQALGTIVEIGVPNSSRRERAGAAILPVKLVSQKTGSIACLEHSRAWACSLKALTAGSSLRAWESCFKATILRALQGTRVLSLMTARGGHGDSLATA